MKEVWKTFIPNYTETILRFPGAEICNMFVDKFAGYWKQAIYLNKIYCTLSNNVQIAHK